MTRPLALATWLVSLFLVAQAPAVAAAAPSRRAQGISPAQRLEALDRHLLSVEQKLTATEAEQAEAQRLQARALSHRAVLTLRLRKAREKLRDRLGALARREQRRETLVQGGARHVSAWLDEQRLWWSVAQADRALWDEVSTTQRAVDDNLVQQRAALAALERTHEQRRRLRDALGHERRRRAEALATLKTQRGGGAAVAALREAGALQVSQVAGRGAGEVNGRPVDVAGAWPAAAAAPSQAGEMPAAARPVLPWPSDGRVRARFGDRVDLAFGTVTRHHGIDIGARAGTRVRAVARGQVVYADWLPGFGQTVIVAHPHAVHSVHAHLQRMHVHVGQGVDAQDTLGLVGDTGSLRGSVLYFELRKAGVPQDPLRWLAHASQG